MKLKKITEIGSDETAGYEVILEKTYMLIDLVKDILLRGEHGEININDSIDYYTLKYKNGILINEIPGYMSYKFVIKADASGGWGRMDYHIIIQKR